MLKIMKFLLGTDRMKTLLIFDQQFYEHCPCMILHSKNIINILVLKLRRWEK